MLYLLQIGMLNDKGHFGTAIHLCYTVGLFKNEIKIFWKFCKRKHLFQNILNWYLTYFLNEFIEFFSKCRKNSDLVVLKLESQNATFETQIETTWKRCQEYLEFFRKISFRFFFFAFFSVNFLGAEEFYWLKNSRNVIPSFVRNIK